MKGFLHRLAASATRPQARLHPFPESVYPAAREQSFAESIMRTEAAASSTLAVEHGAQPASPAASRTSIRPIAPRKDSSEAQPVSASENAPQQHYSQRLRETERNEARAASDSLETSDAAGRSSVSPTASSRTSSSASREFSLEAMSSIAAEYVPIVVERAMQAGSSDTPPLAIMRSQDVERAIASAARQARPAAQVPSTAHAAPVAGDEIQIHIGRIEVVAVPPPAPRPAPAPARKGMSLDEYLNRRNGRIV